MLGEVARRLGLLRKKEYLTFQRKWVGSDVAACNFFLITALCEAGYCKKEKPFFKAADFDRYFERTGWKKITLAELRDKSIRQEPMDVVFQKKGLKKPGQKKEPPGHVMVYVEYHPERNEVTIAQGDIETRVTNESFDQPEINITDWEGGYNVFIKQNSDRNSP